MQEHSFTRARKVNMKRCIITAIAVVAGWSASLETASAQFGTLGQAPIRPRQLNSINANTYYGILRSQQDPFVSNQQLQSRLNPDGSLRGATSGQDTANPLGGLQTGHSASFFNYGHYFPPTPPMGTGAQLGGPGGFGLGGMGSGWSSGLGIAPANRSLSGQSSSGIGVIVR